MFLFWVSSRPIEKVHTLPLGCSQSVQLSLIVCLSSLHSHGSQQSYKLAGLANAVEQQKDFQRDSFAPKCLLSALWVKQILTTQTKTPQGSFLQTENKGSLLQLHQSLLAALTSGGRLFHPRPLTQGWCHFSHPPMNHFLEFPDLAFSWLQARNSIAAGKATTIAITMPCLPPRKVSQNTVLAWSLKALCASGFVYVEALPPIQEISLTIPVMFSCAGWENWEAELDWWIWR